jgi:hypothetical protein
VDQPKEIRPQSEIDAAKAIQALNSQYDTTYFAAVLEIEKGAIDRSRSAADLVQKAATAIGGLYTGVVGISFSVTAKPLPPQGFIPAIFLGLAIAMSTAYVAYVSKPSDVELDPLHTSPPMRMQARINNFFSIVSSAVQRRGYWIRASVVALGVGVFTLPAPFLSTPTFGMQSSQANTNPAQVDLDTEYPWPTPPTASSPRGTILQSILYKAQVEEVAAKRKEAKAAPAAPDITPWIVVTLLLGAVVFGIPFIARH